LGFTQQRLGELGGVSKTTVLSYEAGTHVPGIDYLAAIARFGVDPVYVILGIRSKDFSSSEFNWPLVRKLSELIEEWAETRQGRIDEDIKWTLLEHLYSQFCQKGEIDGEIFSRTLKLTASYK
jgi:transcriptional regulator with XRE-family HTH domain